MNYPYTVLYSEQPNLPMHSTSAVIPLHLSSAPAQSRVHMYIHTDIWAKKPADQRQEASVSDSA
ncbi:Uncharacterized protein Y057_6064 [Fusarium fujikuroi]|nr:Uncharacterized protein Y057_6064 [Fusarium fujikuroi]